MYLYVELWKAKPAWLNLRASDRKAWMVRVLAGLQQQQYKSGVHMLGFAACDARVPRSAGFDYFAVWKMPDKSSAEGFERFVNDAGWYDYFEQVNARGAALDVHGFVSAHLNA